MNEEEYENYIEINSDTIIYFKDWVYDSILNRTIKEINRKEGSMWLEFFLKAKREEEGFLSLVVFNHNDFQEIYNFFKFAYIDSKERSNGMFSKKAHKEILREFSTFMELMYKDERFFQRD